MKRILIVGCGDLGVRLAKNLSGQNIEIFAIKRNTQSLPTFIKPIAWDVTADEKIQIPHLFDSIFFSVAPSDHSEESYRKTYLKGFQNISHLIQDSAQVFFISSTGVYSQNNGEWVNEESETKPTKYSGKILLETERWIEKNIPQTTIVRFSGLYSKERNSTVEKIKNNQFGKIPMNKISNRIHLEDAARILVFLYQKKKKQAIYIGTDSHPTLYCDIVDWYCKKNKIDFTKPILQKIENKKISNKKIISEGFSFLYPSYQEGFLE
jgi:nucleoside-diphosphate-sugar epimerase